ncbi:serine/threonine-protein kinase [Thermoactinospora rubra]|uniref:serine/threonine-protein kinase n=1 Tax=Thermoactinospora rubra TaxID=1088767 RepID=UPI001F0B6EF1
MGEVWRGEDIVLARTVAVKVLLPGRTTDPGFVARFQAEARAMATVNHPGVVDVYDYGVSGDNVYLVMKFVDGEPLDRLLTRLGRIAPESAMELVAQAASALQAVHDQGIVHRDVKPGNLLVQRDGTLVLTDFGIARADAGSRLTDAGMVLGTAAYCAPEQAEGMPVTPAVDIYALGVVAYECLAGVRPFDGDSAVTIALKHIRETPPPLPPDIPAPVRALVERALSKDPAARFPSAAAMSTAARQVAIGAAHLGDLEPVTTGATMARPEPPPRPENTTLEAAPSRRGRRASKARSSKGGLVAGIAVVAVLGVGAGAFAITGGEILNPTPTPTSTNVGAVGKTSSISKPPKSPTRNHQTRPSETKPTVRPSMEDPEPSQEPSTSEPTKTEPTKPTVSPTKPTTTPTVQRKKIPPVYHLTPAAAQELLRKAGFKQVNTFKDHDPDWKGCVKIGAVEPEVGTLHPIDKKITLTVIEDIACSVSPSPSTSPSPTKTP